MTQLTCPRCGATRYGIATAFADVPTGHRHCAECGYLLRLQYETTVGPVRDA